MNSHPESRVPSWLAWVACSALALCTGCGGGGGSANASNTPPVANAGPDQTVFNGDTVTLDGRLSSDAENQPRTYLWAMTTRPAASTATLSDVTSGQPTFLPDVAGTYTATLTVNDGQDSSAPDSVTITVTPDPWSSDAGMPTPRDEVAAVAIGSRIYVLGGMIGGVPTGTVEVFDTTTHSWSTAPAMPNPRAGFAVAAWGSKIYAIGGGPRESNAELASVDEFDTSTNLWSSRAPMPTKRTLAAATATLGTIYVMGGSVSSSCIDWVCKATPAVEAYDIASNTWTTLASLPRPKIGPAAVALGTSIYAIGGEQQAGIVIGGPSNIAHRYDIGTTTWTQVADMPIASSTPTSAAVGAAIFVSLSTTLRYDTVANAWTTLKATPLASTGRLNAASVGSKVFVFTPTATGIYDPALDRP